MESIYNFFEKIKSITFKDISDSNFFKMFVLFFGLYIIFKLFIGIDKKENQSRRETLNEVDLIHQLQKRLITLFLSIYYPELKRDKNLTKECPFCGSGILHVHSQEDIHFQEDLDLLHVECRCKNCKYHSTVAFYNSINNENSENSEIRIVNIKNEGYEKLKNKHSYNLYITKVYADGTEVTTKANSKVTTKSN